MVRLNVILGIARAEARLTRRLVRFWIFMILSFLISAIAYSYYAAIHYFVSFTSATVAGINPRYLVGAFGFYYLFFFLVGLLFLGMDIRARDTRERMVEVLDALPCTNLELVLGKYLGILIPSWISLAFTALLIWAAGRITGETVHAGSLIYLVVFMAIPAFTFVLGLVYLVVLLVRNRLVASVILLLLMAGIYVGFFLSPIWLSPATDMTGGFLNSFPSDLVPRIVTGEGVVHRFAVLLFGFGLLWLAAGVYPRKDDGTPGRRWIAGFLMIAVAAAALGGIVLTRKGYLAAHDRQRAAHEARLDDPAPDLLSIRGEVSVKPGRSLAWDLFLTFQAPESSTLQTALFSLNPGLEVSEAIGEAGGEIAFTQKDGLLELNLPEAVSPGSQLVVELKAAGRPDPRYGFLDASRTPLLLTNLDGQLFLLGLFPAIFENDCVSLLPDSRWLPMSGVDVARGDPLKNPTDFFTLDLTVSAPEGWLPVLPGKREEAGTSSDGAPAYRFAPPAPVDQVALAAGKFVSRSVEMDGVMAEVLLYPDHARNLEVFEDAAPKIQEWISGKLADAREIGLPYPYDSLTLVEVPNLLRGYGGGWRLGSTLAPSAMILMKESGFPTTRFDSRYKDPSDFEEEEGGLAGVKLRHLLRFFDNDFSGGNPYAAASRHFFTGLTEGIGPEGTALNYVFEELSSRLVAGKYGYFSAYLFTRDMGNVINQSMTTFFQGGGQGEFVDALIGAVTSRPSVWDKALGVSLERLDPWEEPKDTVDILVLKGGAMAQSLIDDLGRKKTGAVLGTLRAEHAGSTFPREYLLAAGAPNGVDLAPWLTTWIEQTDLPGFMTPKDGVEAFRLEDSEEGSTRYQILVRVENGEPVPGFLRVEYQAGQGEEAESGSSEPVKVPAEGAVEVGMVSSHSPRNIKVIPYLSLNRTPFTLGIGSIDDEDLRKQEPFVGVRVLEKQAKGLGAVLVDDLDPGFAVENGSGGSRMRVKANTGEVETDQGLPLAVPGRGIPSKWSRVAEPLAFGKYRHTFAIVKTGAGERTAVFTAAIPEAGTWELEVHIPKGSPWMRNPVRKAAVWTYSIEDSGEDREVSLNVNDAEEGWNSLGGFELAGGETRVVLSDRAEGNAVIADGIRWVPPASAGGRPAEER